MSSLTIWVIYEHPLDYPEHYVLRAQHASAGGVTVDPEPAAVARTLDEVRAKVPPGLFRQDAVTGDDPAILETWF